MKKNVLNIDGGSAVRFRNKYLRYRSVPFLIMMLMLSFASSAFAQGSIFGTVTNSNTTTPANGEISFFGFLDDTDEEIRIETSTGAGYDAGNWFDDFQNYLTEAPGNPYDYYFYNNINLEGFHLGKLIPANSFQQENILLAPAAWPGQPAGLGGVGISSTSVLLTWNYVGGLTYHVYRRLSTSNGSFFRLDDPLGALTSPGVADSFFVDNTVDGISSYDYLIIAEDPTGNYSPHSLVATVNSALLSAPSLVSLSPANGPAVGGTSITINGSGFDMNGVTVQIGAAAPVAGTVVSPYVVTAVTPPGTVGAADVTVTNTASALASNTLLGGFTYDANTPPVLAAIGPQTALEGTLLTFATSATDVDGDIPIMTSSLLPGTATYIDNGNGTGSFSWQTTFTDAGIHNVTFYAKDALDSTLVDSEQVVITITDAGNQVPVLALINDTTVAEGVNLQILVSATDADGEIPALSALGLPLNATFVDSATGAGLFSFTPDLTQAGIYTVTFKATDAALAVDSQVVTITVTETNQPPVLALIGPQSTTEAAQLLFAITATDADGTIPVLSVGNLPAGALFTDSLNGTGLFDWTPAFTDSGTYLVTFYATDSIDTDSEIVTITVIDAGNQSPVMALISPQTVAEGINLNFAVTATDPDGTFPALTAVGLPANATFVDSGTGTGIFNFTPDFTQAGLYTITFFASDGLLTDSQLVDITVTESGNQPPVFAPLADTLVDEGGTLVLTISATDPDGGAIPPALSINTALNNFSFVDNHDGTGTFTYTPDFFDAGVDTVGFFATDFGTPQQTASIFMILTTNDINQPPAWVTSGPFGVNVGDTLTFTVAATDSTDPNPLALLFLSVVASPLNSSFTDNGNGTGTFVFFPDSTQAGLDTITFLAVDQGVPQLSATMPVVVNVVKQNIPPILNPIGPQTVLEGTTLIVNVSASDPDGPPPQLIADGLPNNSTFVDNGDGTGVFTFFPDFTQSGLVSVTFKAYDGISITKEVVLIQIYEAGDQAPVFDSIPAPSVVEDSTLQFIVTAFDPDRVGIALSVTGATLPSFVTFVDSGNGVALFTASPGFRDSGQYAIEVIASDGTLADTINVLLTVIDAGNQLPVLAPINDQSGHELIPMSFSIFYSDVDGSDFPLLSSNNLPTGATLTDNRDGTGVFNWTPNDTMAGLHAVTFLLEDFDFPGVFDSQMIFITIADTNRAPFIVTSGSRSIFEGDTLLYTVFATDPDGTIPLLGAKLDGLDSLATNMTFVDSGNGVGVLTFIPDYTQGGTASEFYFVRFFAKDAADTMLVQDATAPVQIEVQNTNAPPVLVLGSGTGPFTVLEGDSLTFTVAATDLDAVFPPTVTIVNAPPNVTFSGVQSFKTFQFLPDFTQAGSYLVTFVATDDQGLTTSQDVQITVVDAGNQTPVFTSILQDTINVPLSTLSQVAVTAVDPDLDVLTLSVDSIYTNLFASFVDSGNGVGVYSVTPDVADLGRIFPLTFIAQDPAGAADTVVTNLLVVSFLRGDMDDNSKYTMNDLAWLIAYLFRGGPSPAVIQAADVDSNGEVNIADVTYLILFLYFNGPAPPQ